MRILLVEDDPALSFGVARALQREGWQVDTLGDGMSACAEGLITQYDLAVLDLGLPRRDGMEVLRHWRSRGARLPVLILTARDELSDRVQGLDSGADDYLVKPFDLPELVARVRALVRRAAGRAEDRLVLGDLELDIRHRELRWRGERVHLSPREQALTELLMARAGRVVPKDHIVSTLSSWETDFSENSVEVYIHRLRKRFADLGVTIKTVRGFGYLMEAAAPPSDAASAPAPTQA
ncbi:response regulator transcription factor [Caldimonas thermodepolymerans]|jgi:two-component system OmpR family response regulator|uniref:Two-component system response regulator n=1 Tax=Caldimonas thermodepolymerans TaxID=215580 RepID=A0A2S5T5Y8_9BURK|nr:response regulator transcription factor [Caldimonas thermodepolymerans]PPE70349.1 two-component system response regulator [Caldimonas thermodepolymerans]QPC30258.1 response regulator transcription factor [Caldimonas thermodepolymerans]RDI00648.1 two-component system response regulator QseB [Caldimonas thermodepolymerans]